MKQAALTIRKHWDGVIGAPAAADGVLATGVSAVIALPHAMKQKIRPGACAHLLKSRTYDGCLVLIPLWPRFTQTRSSTIRSIAYRGHESLFGTSIIFADLKSYPTLNR